VILCLESGEIKDVAACSFIFVCLLGFPQGFPSTVYLSSQSFKRRELGFEASVLTLVLNHVLVCNNLSPFAQFMGCPKRLIKTKPNQLSLIRLLHLKTFMHTHTHAYCCDKQGQNRLRPQSEVETKLKAETNQGRMTTRSRFAMHCCFLLSGT